MTDTMANPTADPTTDPTTDPTADPAGYRDRIRAAFAPFAGSVGDWERSGHLPRELFAALGAAGIFRDRWARGAAAGLPLGRVLVAEMARLNGGLALGVSLHCEVFVQALHRFGGARHAATLESALAGASIGCVALTEPGGGSDIYSMGTAAARVGADGWQLTGTKRFTTNVGRATHLLTLARTGAGNQDFTLFLVPLDRPGVRITRFFETMGVRSVDTGGVEFDARMTDADVVGRAGAGLMYVLKLLDYERIAAAEGVVAGARAALALATAHLRQRTQFGKRLFDHQALAHRLADRWAEVEAAAALIDTACREARGDHLPHHLVAAAKLVAARTSTAAVDEAIQMLGARGYTEDYPLERIFRDARVTRIAGGTDEMLRQIIGMHLDVADAESTALLARSEAAAQEPATPEAHTPEAHTDEARTHEGELPHA